MSDKIRTFIAIEIPGTVKKALEAVQKGMKSYDFRVRWVKPDKMHLTLSFLGDIDRSRVPSVSGLLNSVAATFDREIVLSAKGLGVFPGVKRPRVIWTGLRGDTAALFSLQSRLASGLSDLGFRMEKRPFKAHLTLGRFKGRVNPKNLVEAMERWGDFTPVDFGADKVVLFQSDLKPGGAVYTPLFQVKI